MVFTYQRNDLPPALQSCIFFGIFCCFSFGAISFWFAAQHHRENLVSFFDVSISEWESQYRAQFAATNFTAVSLFDTFDSVTLSKSTNEIFLAGQPELVDPRLLDYQPLKFTNFNLLPYGFFPVANFTSDQEVSIRFKANFTGFDGELKTSEFELPQSFPVTVLVTQPAPTPAPEQKCPQQMKGIYDTRSHMCRVYERIILICVQVKLNATQQWQLHYEEDGAFGCDPHYSWNPYQYRVAKVAKAPGTGPWSTQASFPMENLTDVTITVRHYKDPFLLASVLTNNSMDFGLSAPQWRWLGVMGLLLGLLCCIQPLARLREEYRTKQHMEFFNLLPGQSGERRGVFSRESSGDDEDHYSQQEELRQAAARTQARWRPGQQSATPVLSPFSTDDERDVEIRSPDMARSSGSRTISTPVHAPFKIHDEPEETKKKNQERFSLQADDFVYADTRRRSPLRASLSPLSPVIESDNEHFAFSINSGEPSKEEPEFKSQWIV